VEELTIGTADGRSLTAYDAGDPDGRPILFHHGTPASGVPFDEHVRLARQQGVRLVSYDRAGYGESTRNPERTVTDVARDVEAIADALGLERFATWGLSGGGPHALATAAGLPDRVVAVAAAASIAPPDRPELDLTEGMGEGNIVEFGLAQQGEEALRPALERDFAGVGELDVAGFIDAMRPFLSDVDATALDGELGAYLLDGFRRSLARSVDGWVDDDLAFTHPWGFELEAIRVPILVIQGRQDLMVPWAHGEWLARNLPSAEAWFREEEGHLTLFVNVVPHIHEWLLARFATPGAPVRGLAA
jgi:pimeloyl-ACP methyl ester carboxylesterase